MQVKIIRVLSKMIKHFTSLKRLFILRIDGGEQGMKKV